MNSNNTNLESLQLHSRKLYFQDLIKGLLLKQEAVDSEIKYYEDRIKNLDQQLFTLNENVQ